MASGWRVRSVGRRMLIVTTMAVMVALAALPAAAKPTQSGFKTSQPAMLTNLAGGSVMPIITVGDTIGGYMFEAIPDGIAVSANGKGTVDVYVNHETSTVPFPYPNAAPPTTANSLNDFTPSLVSKLKIHQKSAGVMSASYAIGADENYHRLCSSFIATSEHGFKRDLLLTNEEGVDWVNNSGMAWPAPVGGANAREIGVVVAHDVKNGKTRPIWGMGRHNHENALAVPGFGKPVVLSGDDTFLSNPPHSQMYSYIAANSDALWNDTGDLYAFVPDNAAINDYYDFPISSGMSISGTFIMVPKQIATGKNPDGTDMVGADVPVSLGGPYPAPVTGDMSNAAGTTTPVDGPQWVLEHWSDLNNAFQFIRIEDMAYDKRPGMGNVVYLADSGRGSASTSGNPFASTNGRIWKMVLSPSDPTVVTSLSILIEGDDSPLKTLTEVRQPDNLETTVTGLYITEDPGSSQQFAAGDPAGKNARVWQYRFSDSALTPVLEVDQSADEGPTDVDTTAAGGMGAWEASGIIDVSHIFGPGMFLVDVQAHSLYTHTADGPDLQAPAGGDWLYKREGGQLLLVQIPGG